MRAAAAARNRPVPRPPTPARPPASLADRRTAARAAQCPSAWGEDIGFDPYTCGDDLIIPRMFNKTNTAEKFLNFFKPPGIEQDIIEVPDDGSQGACWTAKAFSSGAAASLPRSASLLTTIAAVSALLLYR